MTYAGILAAAAAGEPAASRVVGEGVGLLDVAGDVVSEVCDFHAWARGAAPRA